jgi:Tol biopolymer transport system component
MKRIRPLDVRVLSAGVALALGVLLVPGVAFAALGTTTRMSVSTAGVGANAVSRTMSISANGRYVAFGSDATNLVAGDTNGFMDVFVRDTWLNTTERVSLATGGAQATGGASYSPALSADGRKIAFVSEATNLWADDTNGMADVYWRDLDTGTTIIVSLNRFGTGTPNSWSEWPSISADGRYVAYTSFGTDVVAGDANGSPDVFRRDVTGGSTSLISAVGGVSANNWSWDANISADGGSIAFASDATNLVTGDTNATSDIFVCTLAGSSWPIARVSVGSAGAQANGGSQAPAISSDGRYVAFASNATNLVSGDTNGSPDVFLRDRVAGATTRVSVGPYGVQANGGSQYPAISADGNTVAFSSIASNLVPGDTNANADVFIRDRLATCTDRISVTSTGAQAHGYSWLPELTPDGQQVVYRSDAGDLVAGDLNGVYDVFLFRRVPQATTATIRTTATSARIGGAPILSGAVTSADLIGRNMVVYVKKPGRRIWSYSSNRTVYSSGASAAWYYKYTFKKGMKKGVYYFKAVVPPWAGFVTSSSRTIQIRLR